MKSTNVLTILKVKKVKVTVIKCSYLAIILGRDEKDQCRGTWLCTDQKGRIGNLLTITVPFHQRKIKAPSRG